MKTKAPKAGIEQAAPIKFGGKRYASIYEVPDIWVMSVSSKMIDEMAYDVKTKTLLVNFSSSSTSKWYAYSKVPLSEWVALTKSSSKGQYFLQNIKDEYDTTKVE